MNTQMSVFGSPVSLILGCATHAPSYTRALDTLPQETKTQHIAAYLKRNAPIRDGKYCAGIETSKGSLFFCYEPGGKPEDYRDDNFHFGLASENHLYVDVGLDDDLDYILLAGAASPTKIDDVKLELREQFEDAYHYTINKLHGKTRRIEFVEKLPWIGRSI